MMITLAVDNGRQGKVDQLGLECVVGVTLTMYQEVVGSHGDALRREIAVKKLSRAQKLALIESVEHSSLEPYSHP
ncbi:hypothetical protein [Shewanella sp. FDAARGOS_354]|uniref:hypothetical protein n=1 Tax=Shewanella sp. FDAARGOS_354 TaxID=1930557 RepID=UPI000B519CE1|nr:hypothetical protein [Shewanella sp. FDAARGOS_354]ASF16512.1 hypothetical protein CEQ32_16900 [Shewanella sp. FDAARGOS_354]